MANYDAAHQARREQGDSTRRKILAELARREHEHEPSPTWAELGEAIGFTPKIARYHCLRLRAAGLVTFADRKPRTLILTNAGREKA